MARRGRERQVDRESVVVWIRGGARVDGVQDWRACGLCLWLSVDGGGLRDGG